MLFPCSSRGRGEKKKESRSPHAIKDTLIRYKREKEEGTRRRRQEGGERRGPPRRQLGHRRKKKVTPARRRRPEKKKKGGGLWWLREHPRPRGERKKKGTCGRGKKRGEGEAPPSLSNPPPTPPLNKLSSLSLGKGKALLLEHPTKKGRSKGSLRERGEEEKGLRALRAVSATIGLGKEKKKRAQKATSPPPVGGILIAKKKRNGGAISRLVRADEPKRKGRREKKGSQQQLLFKLDL